jgi:hypothetical protein
LKVTQTGANSIAEFYDDGNVLALKIADGGNVGIGTGIPQDKLHVYGNVTLSGPDDTPILRFDRPGASFDWEIYTMSGGSMRFRGGADGSKTQLTDKVIFASDGSVGIGTAIPQSSLHIIGSILISPVGTLANPFTNLTDLYSKPPGYYYIRWNNGAIVQNYWDGLWLKVHEEGLNANNFTSYWSDSTTYQMTNFGGLGSGYGHGWPATGSLTSAQNNIITINNLPQHSFIRYYVRWHHVDSIDNELNQLSLYNIHNYNGLNIFWNATRTSAVTFNTNNVYYNTSSSWTSATYSYTPWSNGAAGYIHGYFSIDTNTIWHTSDTFKALHFTGTDQTQGDEACYFTHSTLYLR